MATERQQPPVQFDVFLAHATDSFDEVASGKSVTVERDRQLIRLSPVRRSVRRSWRLVTRDDPPRDIIGIGRYSGPTDVPSNKYNYLADAAADLHAL